MSNRDSDPPAFRVLVVDDSASIRRRVVEQLRQDGFTVTEADSGERALALTLDETFDLVVSDIQMGAVTGVQLCRVLRSDPGTADIPIVLLTAAKDARTRFWGRNAGADAYLAKETMDEKLVPTVQALMEGRELRPSIRPFIKGTPLERVSHVLDRHLFDVVVASEVRRLMDYVHDRELFAEHVVTLAGEVIGAPYIVLRLLGPRGPSYTVLARGPWHKDKDLPGLAALGIPQDAIISTQTFNRPHPKWAGGRDVIAGPRDSREIRVRDETLGEVYVYAGSESLAEQDLATAARIADSLGIVVKSLFLMEEARTLALTDGLTGLYNRRHATERLAEEVARAHRYSTGLCVALCDVDHFKSINDEFGHGVGDRVLRQIAGTLLESVRREDVVSRWGGEEFLVIFSDITPPTARVVAERLRQQLETQPSVQDGPERITASIGLATLTPGMSPETLIEEADQALYRAKGRGRNRVEVA